MENLTFEKLPQAVSELHDKLSRIEQLLLERQGPEKEEEMFTVAQAAAFLKISVGTVYLKVSSREIPVNKRGIHLTVNPPHFLGLHPAFSPAPKAAGAPESIPLTKKTR